MSKVIVTGGAGFLGSHLVDKLLDEGFKVIVLDNLSSGDLRNLRLNERNLTFIKCDLKYVDPSWTSYFKDVDVVFHFAANPEVRISTIEPRVHFEENVLTTFNVPPAVVKKSSGFSIWFLINPSVSSFLYWLIRFGNWIRHSPSVHSIVKSIFEYNFNCCWFGIYSKGNMLIDII